MAKCLKQTQLFSRLPVLKPAHVIKNHITSPFHTCCLTFLLQHCIQFAFLRDRKFIGIAVSIDILLFYTRKMLIKLPVKILSVTIAKCQAKSECNDSIYLCVLAAIITFSTENRYLFPYTRPLSPHGKCQRSAAHPADCRSL